MWHPSVSSLSLLPSSTMPSSSITIALCFLAFVFGQIFHAFCARIAHPVTVKIETVAIAAPVDSGISFVTIFWIVLPVLLVHDLVIMVVIAHLFKDQKGSFQAAAILKRLQVAAVSSFFSSRGSRSLLPPTTTSALLKRHSHWPIVIPWRPASYFLPPAHVPLRYPFTLPPAINSIPRPFWRGRALYLFPTGYRFEGPLVESSLALALVNTQASTRQPFVTFIIGRRVGIRYFKIRMPFMHLYGAAKGFTTEHGVKTNKRMLKICDTDREETVESKVQDKAPEEQMSENGNIPEDVPVNTRSSQAHLLRHVAAAALLRKLSFKVPERTPCHANIEEVDDGEEAARVVYVDTEVDVQKGLIQATKKIVEVEEKINAAVEEERVDGEVKTVEKKIVEEIEAVAEDVDPAGEEEVELADAASRQHDAEKKVKSNGAAYEELEGLPSYENFANEAPPEPLYGVNMSPYEDLNRLPSYEEFAKEVPPEALFEKRFSPVTTYDVLRPPPLVYFASRIGAVPKAPRASHRHVLARLSARIAVNIAESIQV
ncbi:hypothetical protein MSAN_02334600 [Mycena sanguinolenta]|uniref:Uncharacterized protein n=1 Tax=Mycena sanguinolenta TaxID=230812 RepID=A0A8H6X6W3_9AGAR|nr:hypothetical protein MSAN_02334600 [Mycena sanguinolenta]